MAPMFRHTDQGTKAKAAWKGLRCTIQIFPLISSNKLVLLAATALPVFLSKPRTHGSILAIKKIFQTASFILEIWYVCCSAQEAKSFCGICFTFLMVRAHYK